MSVRNAQNESVDKDLVKIPDIPGTPTIGTATDVGTNRAYNNGAATITYTGNAYWGTAPHRATSSPGSFNALASSSPITVTGLQSATAYTFTVSGESFAGSSAASAASNSITATTVPQAPTIGTVSVTDSTTVSIPFTAGATGGKSITSYTVTSSPSISLSTSGTTTPLTVTGNFSANQAYTFTIAANNANGTSSSSSASNSITPYLADYVAIATFTATGGETSFTFDSIPQTYKHLQLRSMYKDTYNLNSSQYNLKLRFNSVSTFAYTRHYLDSGSGSITSTGSASTTEITVLGAGSESGFGVSIIDILDYTATSKIKVVRGFAGSKDDRRVTVSSGIWNNTSAITSVFVFPDVLGFDSGSTFTLYGLKG